MEKVKIFRSSKAGRVEEFYNDWMLMNGDKIEIIERKANCSASIFEDVFIIAVFYVEK